METSYSALRQTLPAPLVAALVQLDQEEALDSLLRDYADKIHRRVRITEAGLFTDAFSGGTEVYTDVGYDLPGSLAAAAERMTPGLLRILKRALIKSLTWEQAKGALADPASIAIPGIPETLLLPQEIVTLWIQYRPHEPPLT